MRALRCLTVGLVSVTGGLALAVCASPAAAAPPFGATLSLDPSSGKAGTTITATFQVNQAAVTAKCRLRVTYRWDAQVIGQDTSDTCVSTVRFKAPHSARDAGPHQVSAVDGTTHQVAAAIFMVTGADATTEPSPTPTRTRSVRPSPTGTDSANVDQPLPPYPAATSDPSLDAVNGHALPQVKPASSLSAWALIFGGGLVLGGVAILILVVLRMRRGDPEPDGYAGDEPALVPPARSRLGDYPTQQIHLGPPEAPD
jgi:hypothetical protein